MTDRLTYLICATPRSGSTLLCSLLRSSGVAGRPESYFREQDEGEWAARWGVDTDDYPAFVRAAVAAGATPNGVVGVRVMWGTVEHVVERLHGSPGEDLATLVRALGTPLRFLHLRRDDLVGQAVSWARSEQTGYWHPGDRTTAEPQFDLEQIDRLVRTITEHNRSWRQWFERYGLEPYPITYEQLAAQPVATARAVLDHLGLDHTDAAVMAASDRMQADDLNAEWIDRYRAGRR